MARISYLHTHPKTGVFYFRKRIPQSCVDSYGKKELIFSLKTKDRRIAERLAAAYLNALYDLLNMINPVTVPETEIGRAHYFLWQHNLAKWPDEITLPNIRSLIVRIEQEYTDAEADAFLPGHQKEVRCDYVKGVISFDEYRHKLRLILQHLKLYEQMFLEEGFKISPLKRDDFAIKVPPELAGRVDGILRAKHPHYAIASAATVADMKKTQTPRLSEAFEKWKQRRSRPKNTLTEWTLAVNRFTSLFGDLPVGMIEGRQVAEFREALQIVPAQLKQPYRDMEFAELVKLAKAGTLDGMGKTREAGGINKMLTAISSILELMLNDDIIDRNVAHHKLLPVAESDRRPYTAEEIRFLFNSPLFANGYWKRGRLNRHRIKPEEFWLTLILFCTGARTKEIAQLDLRDIVEEESGIFFMLRPRRRKQAGKTLKTLSSRRAFCANALLLKCGFKQYVDEMINAGETKLFPGLYRADGSPDFANFSKWFGRYSKSVGLKAVDEEGNPSSETVLYSLRHCFIDICRNSNLEAGLSDRLVGHTEGGVKRNYGLGYSNLTLARAAAALDFESYWKLDLQRLYVFPYRNGGRLSRVEA